MKTSHWCRIGNMKPLSFSGISWVTKTRRGILSRMLPSALRLFGVLLLGGFFGSLQAKEKWLYTKTDHFEVLSDCGESDTREQLFKLERFREAMARLLGEGPHDDELVRVVLFGSTRTFKAYLPLVNGKAADSLAGFYSDTPSGSLIAMSGDFFEQEESSTVLQGYSYRIIRDKAANLPDWYVRGIAAFYSTFVAERDGTCSFGNHISYYVSLLGNRGCLDLKTLFAFRDPRGLDEGSRDADWRNATSWALIHYWRCGTKREYRIGFQRIQEELAAGRPSEEAFRDAFGMTPEKMHRELEDYVENRSTYYSFRITNPSEIKRNQFKFRPATEAEVELCKLRTGWHARRDAETENKLKDYLLRHPEEKVLVYELLADGAYMQNRSDDGLNYFQQAADSGSKNPRVLAMILPHYLNRNLANALDQPIAEETLLPFKKLVFKHWIANPTSEELIENQILLQAISASPEHDYSEFVRGQLGSMRRPFKSTLALALIMYRNGNYNEAIETATRLVDNAKVSADLQEIASKLITRCKARERDKEIKGTINKPGAEPESTATHAESNESVGLPQAK